MVSSVKSFLHYFATYPLRGVLTLLTIAIGVGALIITFSLSFDVNNALEASLADNGRRVAIANARIGADGNIARQIPSGFDGSIIDLLGLDYEHLRDLTIVADARWNRISAGGTSYQVRSASAVGIAYADLMGLEMLAGSFFSAEDLDARRQVAVISESTARILFGSAEAALGNQVLSAVARVNTAAQGQARFRTTQEPFRIQGVYADVSELERTAFGISDFLIPVGSNLPAGLPVGFDPSSTVMARLVNDSVEVAESRIRSIVESEYGEETRLSVWEGSPAGPAPMIEESRETVRSFSLTINVLGIVILVASSIGIFSIMLVEVLNRMREIGLRRALGATQAGIRRFFLSQALYFSVAGGALGTGLAFLFYRLVGASLAPFFEVSGLSPADLDLSAPGAIPILLALTAALIMGTVFGFFPAISASRTSIVEAIREDAA